MGAYMQKTLDLHPLTTDIIRFRNTINILIITLKHIPLNVFHVQSRVIYSKRLKYINDLHK